MPAAVPHPDISFSQMKLRQQRGQTPRFGISLDFLSVRCLFASAPLAATASGMQSSTCYLSEEKKTMLLYSISVHGYLLKGRASHPYAMSQVLPFLKKKSPLQRKTHKSSPSQGRFAQSFIFGAQLGTMASDGPFQLQWCGDARFCLALVENPECCCRCCCKGRIWGCKTTHVVQSEKQMRISAFGYYQHQMEVREKTVSRTPPMHQFSQGRLMKWLALPHDFLKA